MPQLGQRLVQPVVLVPVVMPNTVRRHVAVQAVVVEPGTVEKLVVGQAVVDIERTPAVVLVVVQSVVVQCNLNNPRWLLFTIFTKIWLTTVGFMLQ